MLEGRWHACVWRNDPIGRKIDGEKYVAEQMEVLALQDGDGPLAETLDQ